ncbi:unnamed protein product [Lepeophtheirus salmonis]|uniref:(salmon louse) hypothetical protein n=1 Tax=Lepeophtheirus salmonis TaxID=72036 RepID=A0A7R8HCV5_LEPSM|nr:unnamed protein product [Lepeophtheirus salmonis]CAF3009328.1 unnamed protein product [Lepeophtheirus salmonis]
METNNDSQCCVLDESNTLEFTQKTSEQMEGNKDALECISSEQNQVTTKTCGKGRGIDSCSTLILGEATATICSCTDHLCNASNSLPVPRLNLILPLSVVLDILQGNCPYGTLLPTLEALMQRALSVKDDLSKMTAGLSNSIV